MQKSTKLNGKQQENNKSISIGKTFDFCNTESKTHLADDISNINIESFPNNYAYFASEWKRETQILILLFKKYN
jgi:hypothetical protein